MVANKDELINWLCWKMNLPNTADNLKKAENYIDLIESKIKLWFEFNAKHIEQNNFTEAQLEEYFKKTFYYPDFFESYIPSAEQREELKWKLVKYINELNIHNELRKI